MNSLKTSSEPQSMLIGTQTFEALIKDNHVYVDKTAQIYKLIQSKGIYFLSRPRRFGKSLLLSTMKAIFENRRELFTGLAIDTLEYSWQKYPVIKLDMSALGSSDPEQFDFLIKQLLIEQSRQFGITGNEALSPGMMFFQLIKQLQEKEGPVVILIDEYDKPILDVIDNKENVSRMKEKLSAFYGILKPAEEYLRFLFITGVSRFSRTSIFSGLNNLKDLSLHEAAATLVGYTDNEIDHYFSHHCHVMQEYLDTTYKAENTLAVREELRALYNGYLFYENNPLVYNPFSVMSALDAKKFRHYWFATGTPTFLIKSIKMLDDPFTGVEGKRYSSEELGQFEQGGIFLPALLFQTGYLTLDNYNHTTGNYSLKIPNREVREALSGALLTYFVGRPTEGMATEEARQLRIYLDNNDLPNVFAHLSEVISRIPYDLHASTEGYYATIFYLIFWFSAQRVVMEEKMARGAIDAVVSTTTHHYIFEFKLNKSAKAALSQIEKRTYWQPYALDGKKIVLVGANFSSKTRTLKNWIYKEIEQP